MNWFCSTAMPALALLVLGSALAGCSPQKDAATTIITPPSKLAHSLSAQAFVPWFEEIGKQAGLGFEHQSGHREKFFMPEINSGGVGVLDFDGDGLMDIFCVQGGSLYADSTNAPGHRLYKNLGNWKFEDVTETALLPSRSTGYGMGVACADFDADGHVDVLVTQVGSNILYRNTGRGTFEDVTKNSGVKGHSWGTSAAFFDYDQDGHLDLFIANYLRWSPGTEVECFSRGGRRDYCSPLNYQAPAMDTLFRNRGDGTFEDVTLAAGLDKAFGTGLGVGVADFDRDGKPDIFVANDAMPNQLWINQGHGKFKDEAMIRGCAVNAMGVSEAGMGVVVLDLFQQGQWDIFVTHLAGELNRVFSNSNGWFHDLVLPRGPGATSAGSTGFGVVAADFNNDGLLDLYLANGRVRLGPTDLDPSDPYAEPNSLLRGMGSGEFESVGGGDGVNPLLLASSRGLASADFDNDGAIDLLVANRDSRFHLLRNLAKPRGQWIRVRVLNASGSDALGAMVSLESLGKTQRRQVRPHESYCSSNDPRIHFGLGQASQADRLTVVWPDGSKESYGPLRAGQEHILRHKRRP